MMLPTVLSMPVLIAWVIVLTLAMTVFAVLLLALLHRLDQRMQRDVVVVDLDRLEQTAPMDVIR